MGGVGSISTLIVPWAPQVRGPRGACPGPPSQSDSPYTDRKVTPPPQALNISGALGPCTENTHGSVITLSTWRKLKTPFGRSSARSLTALHSFLDFFCSNVQFSYTKVLFSASTFITRWRFHSTGLVIPTRQATFLPLEVLPWPFILSGLHSPEQILQLFHQEISHFIPFSQ